MTEKVDMSSREAAIIRFIREADPTGATVRETWEALRDESNLGDQITLPAYHRIMNRMAIRGKLTVSKGSDSDSLRFNVADYLIPENALSLEDIEEGLWALSAPEAVARYMDALDYFEGAQKEVLSKAATSLLDEEPVELVLAMLKDKMDALQESINYYLDEETRDKTVEERLLRQHEELCLIAYSFYGLSPINLNLGTVEALKSKRYKIEPDWEIVRKILKSRVFGDHVLYWAGAKKPTTRPSGFVVGASDGSTHAGYVHVVPGAEYIEDAGQLVLTFNNSIARLDLPQNLADEYDFPCHGVPMTRAALEDPTNRGMILARPWYPQLEDSEYEHMKKSALDVVQFRIDERIITGTARALGNDRTRGAGKLLPRPQVHFRDGSVVPQEREFNHYCFMNPYGEMVREGIALSYNILRAIKDSNYLTFAGVVKSTQLKTFSFLVNWYIARGSALKLGKAIDPTWNVSRAGHITDNHLMTRLLASIPPPNPERVLCSFGVLRPFPQLVTTLRDIIPEGSWVDYFEGKKNRQVEEQKRYGGSDHFLKSVYIADDPYVRMCQEADYVMFYIGHTAGQPTPLLPRYEFLDALRNLPQEDTEKRVKEKMNMILDAVVMTGWSLDSEHNFMTDKNIIRIIPAVVYNAHEKCKVWGQKLEAELKSAIVARLSELRRLRNVTPSGLNLVPIQIKEYLLKMQKSLSSSDKPQLGAGSKNDGSEDKPKG